MYYSSKHQAADMPLVGSVQIRERARHHSLGDMPKLAIASNDVRCTLPVDGKCNVWHSPQRSLLPQAAVDLEHPHHILNPFRSFCHANVSLTGHRTSPKKVHFMENMVTKDSRRRVFGRGIERLQSEVVIRRMSLTSFALIKRKRRLLKHNMLLYENKYLTEQQDSINIENLNSSCDKSSTSNIKEKQPSCSNHLNACCDIAGLDSINDLISMSSVKKENSQSILINSVENKNIFNLHDKCDIGTSNESLNESHYLCAKCKSSFSSSVYTPRNLHKYEALFHHSLKYKAYNSRCSVYKFYKHQKKVAEADLLNLNLTNLRIGDNHKSTDDGHLLENSFECKSGSCSKTDDHQSSNSIDAVANFSGTPYPSVAANTRSCSEEARQEHFEDTSLEELAAYFDDILYFPKEMSSMAEMMYT